METVIAAFRTSIEEWFDDAMERVTGWYKRKVQLIILGLALVICFSLNIDTFTIANGLYRDNTLRESIVAVAEARAQQPISPDTESNMNVSEIRDELSGLGLPIGWSTQDGDPRSIPGNVIGWVGKLLGVLFTAFAITLGAPFWFDILNKFINLRASGKQPERTVKTAPAASS